MNLLIVRRNLPSVSNIHRDASMTRSPLRASGAFCLLAMLITVAGRSFAIEPWSENGWFWSHAGKPVMLLGGSDDDNLFQWPAERLIPQLDRIAAAGGNVVRNTMSDRQDAGFEVYPFLRLESGKYDLTQWNPEYWERFERFLAETDRRGIFIQIEIWDRFDYADNTPTDRDRWGKHPYNPVNNINYTVKETTLAKSYPDHPGQNKQPFFFSTPEQRNIEPLLQIQQAFVNKVLDHSLAHDHVLYCIDNETNGEEAWSTYWADFLHERAKREGKTIYVTEMWDDWDLRADRHRRTFDHPQRYAYVDISQNNHNRGEKHWDNLRYVRQRLSDHPRPINTTKTYGADGNKFGHTDQDAVERFWRHLLGGVASARFHRPDSGLGINDKAVACIAAARRVEAMVSFWDLSPNLELVSERQANEAYVAANKDQSTIVVYFPAQDRDRQVKLEKLPVDQAYQVHWIGIDPGHAGTVVSGKAQSLKTGSALAPPRQGNHVAVLRRTGT